ncbi:MAG: helix-turn-helix domain-containing protein [Verrucomicrobiales bacterium]|nr:helix-turn-helix domain-containing protein [Verrucomicrobiales bacterium]
MKTTSSKAFGKNICKFRTSAGVTQEQLAEQADISRRYVQLIEAGTYTPTVTVAARLRRALGITWHDLMRGV